MEEWKEYKLGELCNTISDTYKRRAKEVVLINTSDVLEGKCMNHERVLNEKLKGQFKKTFQYNDILYSEIRPANKRFAFVDFDATDYIASTKLMVLRHNDIIIPQYLFYIIKSQNVIDELQMLAESRSGTFPQITFSELSNLSVLLPNKDLQYRIVSILSSLDDKIEVNRRINEQLEELAGALFKSWFVDFEPFKDGEFVDSELGMIPRGWKVGTLGELCITNKRTYGAKFANEIAYLDTGSVTKNQIEGFQILNPEVDKIPSRARRAVTEGDILFSSVRPNQKHYAFLFAPQTNMVASTGFIVITANWSGYRYFIYQYLIQEEIIDKLQAIAEQSVSTYPSINASDITNLKLVIPPMDIIGKFAGMNLAFMSEIDKNQQEITQLTTLRDTLLPKLMSGEIDVNLFNV
ncbi:MAG: restriction endonuclease subunit S [Bacteroidaceae bacterium]|nr:restriction endonuclease subunit S [Bacteroidaceae bacterium]